MKLGRLARIDPREVWLSEPQHFTPWLAREENIELLSETLGLELEVEAQEKQVGPFRADILCKDVGSDAWVLIENQLEKTDHRHLGQLLTYAAGLQAVTIVWIAAAFNEEHRATLDWLNKITDEKFRFFGLEVELWRIGESEPAPKFNIVSKPNAWSKQAGQAARQLEDEAPTETKQIQLEFWQAFYEAMASHKSLTAQKPRPQHWTNLAIGRSGIRLGCLINSRDAKLGVELYMGRETAKAFYQQLYAQKDDIEAELGYQLDWRELPDKQACRIVLMRENSSLQSRAKWTDYIAWLISTLEDFNRVFRNRVRTLEERWHDLGHEPGADILQNGDT